MSYVFENELPNLFTNAGLRLVINSLHQAIVAVHDSGACTDRITTLEGVGAADAWTMIAARDYLCQLGYLKQVTRHGNTDIYVPGNRLVDLLVRVERKP